MSDYVNVKIPLNGITEKNNGIEFPLSSKTTKKIGGFDRVPYIWVQENREKSGS